MTCLVVGVLNVTPDSFSDGGRFVDQGEAVSAALQMVQEGAAWIDVGGESTRPGARPVSADDEIARVVPVIRQLARALSGRARISIDTYKAATARAALEAGAGIVNDISGGLLDPEILDVAAAAGAPIVLGHLRGQPATMMENVFFQDVVAEVTSELAVCIAAAVARGCRDVWVDPGIGFGKHSEDNLRLLADVHAIKQGLGRPVMVGVSRKRFLGDLTGLPADSRTFGTAAAVAAAVLSGADAVRVHDVEAMHQVVTVASAIRAANRAP